MTTSTLTLTEFLLARIAEDEAAARRHDFGRLSEDGWLPRTVSPARVLAECEAKRRIVEYGQRVLLEDPNDGYRGYLAAITDAVKAIALPYADHPDYRDEWRP